MDWGSALASGNGQFMTLEMARSIRWSDALLDDLEFSLKGLLKGYYGGFFTVQSGAPTGDVCIPGIIAATNALVSRRDAVPI